MGSATVGLNSSRNSGVPSTSSSPPLKILPKMLWGEGRSQFVILSLLLPERDETLTAKWGNHQKSGLHHPIYKWNKTFLRFYILLYSPSSLFVFSSLNFAQLAKIRYSLDSTQKKPPQNSSGGAGRKKPEQMAHGDHIKERKIILKIKINPKPAPTCSLLLIGATQMPMYTEGRQWCSVLRDVCVSLGK